MFQQEFGLQICHSINIIYFGDSAKFASIEILDKLFLSYWYTRKTLPLKEFQSFLNFHWNYFHILSNGKHWDSSWALFDDVCSFLCLELLRYTITWWNVICKIGLKYSPNMMGGFRRFQETWLKFTLSTIHFLLFPLMCTIAQRYHTMLHKPKYIQKCKSKMHCFLEGFVRMKQLRRTLPIGKDDLGSVMLITQGVHHKTISCNTELSNNEKKQMWF